MTQTDTAHVANEFAIDINSRGTIGAAVILGTIGVLSFIVQPGLVQGFVSELGLSEIVANDLAFYEMIGVAAASISVSIVSRTVNWRTIIAASLLLSAAGNVGSALITEPGLFHAVRFITGFGEGGVIATSFAVIGLTAKTERNLALYLVLLLTYGAFGLWAMPTAFDVIGLKGIFLFWALLTIGALVTTRFLPVSADSRQALSPTAARVGTPMIIIAFGGVLFYNTAVGIAWANLFLIGMEILPDEQAIANALLLSQFVAIAGALVPVFMEARLGRWSPIIIGIFGGAGFIAILLGDLGYLGFVIAVCGFNFLWNFVMPFILSSVNDMETRGEIMSRAIAMQMIGLGFGPFIAARILGETSNFKAVEWATITLLLLSFALLAIAKLARRRAYRRAQSELNPV